MKCFSVVIKIKLYIFVLSIILYATIVMCFLCLLFLCLYLLSNFLSLSRGPMFLSVIFSSERTNERLSSIYWFPFSLERLWPSHRTSLSPIVRSFPLERFERINRFFCAKSTGLTADRCASMQRHVHHLREAHSLIFL